MNATVQERARMAAAGGAEPATLVPGLYTDYLPPKLKNRARDFFGYQVTSLNLLAGAAAQANFAVQNDSDFLAVALVGTCRDPANPETLFAAPALTIQIEDSGSGRFLFNQQIDWAQIVGTSQLPAYLPYPKIIPRASVVTWTFTSIAGAQAYDIRAAVLGFKIFDWPKGG